MARIVALTSVSLDGVMEDPVWTGPYFNSDHAKFAFGQLFAADALLLGRVTFEGMAAAWPHMSASEGAFAERINALPKHVVSKTLRRPGWNATVLRGDVGTEVAALKARYARDILVYASGRLTRSLIGLGLVDELKLWLHPVLIGTGKRLFPEGTPAATWRLATTTTFSSGAALLDYRPVTRP